MSDPITGKNAHLMLDNAAGTPTDISSYITSLTPTANTEEFGVKVWKATRVNKVSGFKEEDWEIKGPWTPEADTFFRALAGEDEGKGIDYEHGPDGNDAGKTKFTGTCNVNHYEIDEVSAEGVVTYTARLSILTKVVGTFSA